MAAKKHKVLWEDSAVPFDNVPFVVVRFTTVSMALIDISARKREIKRWLFAEVFFFQ